MDREKWLACIEACFECAQACAAGANASLSEDMIADLVKCVRANLDCAEQSEATGRVLSRHTGYDANMIRAVLEGPASRPARPVRTSECEAHASEHGHCRVCAQACRRCERACRELIDAL
ncbi:four-helix bundle copper-binding protein [Nocardiopsis oceani]